MKPTVSSNRRDVIVITGASGGIGRATAHRFARDGARIALLARGEHQLEATAREVRELGGEPLIVRTDVTDPKAVFAAAERVEQQLGPIDIWINNAMSTIFSRIQDVEPDEFRRATEVTYLGVVWGTQAALRAMRPRDRGVIIQVGSALAYRGIPLQAAYCGAKFACRGFTEAVRCELIHDRMHIHIGMVHLPGVNTPQFQWCLSKMEYRPRPVPPIFQPEIAADAIHYAAHHRRREIYVGNSSVQTIVGSAIAPGFLDHYLAHAAFEGQFTEQKHDPGRVSNLFHPAPTDYGTHGPFDAQARSRDLVTRATTRLGAAGTRSLLLLIGPLWLAIAVLPSLARGLRRNLPSDARSRSSSGARRRRPNVLAH
jgi:NAD(P)-dependent dehydrogenase (short-subunit alcohol dehydrogenase family)